MDLEWPVYDLKRRPIALRRCQRLPLAVRYDRICIVVRHAAFLRKPDLVDPNKGKLFITDKEKQNYYQPSKVYSSFGRDFTNDYIALHVYDMNDVLLVTKIMSLDEVGFTEDGTFVDLNIGQHLRSLGFRQGDYKVTYKFLRRLAGRPRTIFVAEKGKIFTGDVERKLINGETRYFQKTSDEEKSNNEPIEVFIREQKYITKKMKLPFYHYIFPEGNCYILNPVSISHVELGSNIANNRSKYKISHFLTTEQQKLSKSLFD